MKKLFLTLGAASLCLSSFAAERILYTQNFETVGSAADAGWSYNGGSMTIASDEYGKFLELALGQNNGRTGFVDWGTGIFQDADGNSVLEDGTYTVKFDFSVKQNSNNQYNTEITLFTTAQGVANQPYRGRWSGDVGPYYSYLFDLYQANTAADADMLAAINAPYTATPTTDDEGNTTYSYSVDLSDAQTVQTGNWYTVTCNVNTNTRVVDYTVIDLSGNQLAAGEMPVPENNMDAEQTPVSMFAQGIWVMTARYQTTLLFDNIVISYESSQDVANDPVVALTGLGVDQSDMVNYNMRKYSITFMDGETLHLDGAGASNFTIDYADCDGAYDFWTTTSGTLKAWTTSGTATSNTIEIEVDCSPVYLPAATATISAVEAGYGKTYTLSVNNADVPLRPTIFMNYVFNGTDGARLEEEGVASGATVTVPGEGTLTITTEAFGYMSTNVDVVNDLEFSVKKDYDFARLTDEEQAAAGFTSFSVLNSGSTSGFNNWTARKRLFYYDINQPTGNVDDAGNPTYTEVYPFGFLADDNTTNVIEYSELATDANPAGDESHFEGLTVYAGHNLCYMKHIGVYNNETSGGNNKNIDVLRLNATDFVVINRINNYGGNSCHPVVATTEEYYAVLAGENEVYSASANGVQQEDGTYTISCPVYRIDTACTKLTVFEQVGGSGGVSDVTVDSKVENNDPYYYTIEGIRLAEPTHPGIYIHQGKKIIVR